MVGGELRINLRLPDGLYAKVAQAAKGKGVTPAEFCRVTLASALGRPFSSASGESHQKTKKATCGADCYKNAEISRIQVKPPTTPKGVAAKAKAKGKNGRAK